MPDFLDVLARDAKATVEEGYYEHPQGNAAASAHVSLREAILNCNCASVIAEIKGASPSAGVIRSGFEAGKIALAMARGGAAGISVLTEPKHFEGSLSYLAEARRAVQLPLLMKDIIVSSVQLDAAARIGANAVLLIQALYDRGYGEFGVREMIEVAHSRRLEVLLEVHDEDEFQRAIASYADLVGINNRNLRNLRIDLNVTKKRIEDEDIKGKIVVSESGISTAADIRFLNGCGAKAFLIGSAIMSADDVESKIREFTMALQQDELKI